MEAANLAQIIAVSSSLETPAIIEVDPVLLEQSTVDRRLQALGYLVARIDDEAISNANALFLELSQILQFPEYFGFNWDALKDCLADMSWKPADGYILIFPHPEALPKADLQTFVKIIRAVSGLWLPYGRPFKLLLPRGVPKD